MKIIGYENYEIFEDGRVYSHINNIFMKQTINKKTGYLQVTFYNKGNPKTFQVHRLVAEHFINNPYNKPQINHKNGIKTDNRKENLEWVSDRENKIHCYNIGLKNKNVLSKPLFQINVITNEIIAIYNSANEASRILNINQGSISNCCNGKCKTYKGYKWKYKEV